MANDNTSSAIHTVIDTILFIAALVAISACIRGASLSLSLVKKDTVVNTTIQANQEIKNYDGYYMDGVRTYDGAIQGSQVYSDILKMDRNVKLFLDGNNLSLKMEGEIPFLEYVREGNSKKLMDMIDFNATYIRKYKMDTNGNLDTVFYVKE